MRVVVKAIANLDFIEGSKFVH